MPILYYPGKVQKKFRSPIEELQRANKNLLDSGRQDLAAAALDHSLWPAFASWNVKQVNLRLETPVESDVGSLSTETSTESQSSVSTSGLLKTYSLGRQIGRGVITGLNDKIWFKIDGAPAQAIVLSQQFYATGDELAAELEDRLNENAAFQALSADPFEVTFSETTGKITISPDSGTIKFVATNTTTNDFHKDSDGGAVIGFTQDSSDAASITSDTEIPFAKVQLVGASDSSNSAISITDNIALTVDDALYIEVSSVPLVATWAVTYQEA